MSKSRRLSYRLHEGEAILVGPVENFENLVEIYEGLARSTEYSATQRQAWRNCASWVREWVKKSTAKIETDV